jgi:hypothetical protein
LPITELSVDEAILHALNRLAYGPRPGDVERVKQMGLAKWIDEQLNPGAIDDKALEARLENYPTLRMSSAKLLDEYPQPKQAEKQEQKRAVAVVEPEQRRPDAAAQTVARDMQAGQGSTNAAADGQEAPQQTAESAPSKQEMSDAPAPEGSATYLAEAIRTMCRARSRMTARGRNAWWPNCRWPK